MNKIAYINGKYIVTCEDGSQLEGKIWLEKKTNRTYLKLPKENLTGREYITLSKIPTDGSEFSFESKTSGPRVLGNWRSLMTKEEAEEYAACEAKMAAIEAAAKARKAPDENSIEGIELKIAQLLAKKNALLNN